MRMRDFAAKGMSRRARLACVQKAGALKFGGRIATRNVGLQSTVGGGASSKDLANLRSRLLGEGKESSAAAGMGQQKGPLSTILVLGVLAAIFKTFDASAVAMMGGLTSAAMVALFTETIAPTLGVVIEYILYATSVPAMQKVRAEAKLGSLNPLPFVVSLANCVAWCGYGFVTKNPFIILSNLVGVLSGLYNTMTSVRHADNENRKLIEIVTIASASVLLGSGFASSILFESEASRRLLFGYLANGFLMVYYASPLSTLKQVLTEKSSASLYWPLSLVCALNGGLWLIYGLAMNDNFIIIPNGFGLVIAALQLLFCGIFPRGARPTSKAA